MAAPISSAVAARSNGSGLNRSGQFSALVPIISAAARNNVPAVYWQSVFAREGGFLSYGADPVDPWHRVATYVDRIAFSPVW